MTNKMDFSRLMPMDQIIGEDEKDTYLLRQMGAQAKEYLSSFEWCKSIEEGGLGWGVGGIAAVFLFRIIPASSEIDDLLWVIIGDLPPAYLVTDESPTPLDALGVYVNLMDEWVATVRAGESIENCIPVNTLPTLENADTLEIRLSFLKQKVLTADGEAHS